MVSPQHRRNKNLRVYYQCNLKGQRNIYFGGVSDGKKLIGLNRLPWMTKMIIFVSTLLFVWTPYLNLHASGKNVSAGINQFCSNADATSEQGQSFAIVINIPPGHSDLASINLAQYFVLPLSVIELQLVMGNVERNPGPVARSENLFSKLIQGHCSQGHEKFGEFAGLQCVAIAVYAAAFTCVKQISRWTSDTLDSIVEQGNELFKSINKHRYLGAEDIPITVNVYDLAISVSLNFNVHGFLSRQDDHHVILQNYVHENQSLNSGFLIWLSNLCIYVHIQHQSKKIVYYLFDSHARDREGQLSENGTSVLINFLKLEHLMEYLCHTYLDKTGKNEIHYQLQFLMCSCAASRPKQQQVSRKHRSSLQIEKDKEAKRQKLRKKSYEERTIRLEKREPTSLQKCQMKM